jgi:exodeoxyribonuclease VII small subunit
MTGPKKSEKNQNLEEKLKELEQIVQSLEKGQISLDESLRIFERGVELYQNCRETLEGAEKKIKILTDNLKEEDFRSK